MTEQTLIRKQLLKNMLLSFIAFTLIFSIIGIILYAQVENSLYMSSDDELLNSRNRTGILSAIGGNYQEPLEERNDKEPPVGKKRNNAIINPRLVYIIRDENGNIQEQNSENERYSNIAFDSTNLNKIYMTSLDNLYNYRGINYKIDTGYVQILINVDAEEAIISNFKTMLILLLVLAVGIVLAASYILSTITLKPIIESWKKQTEFVQNASHELRTPLTIIQAKQEILLEKPESKIIDNAEDISITLGETRRLSKLVKDLMELARSDSNKTKLEKSSTDIDLLIKNVTEPFEEMAKMQGKNLKLQLGFKKNINIDSNKIHELIIIILDNSIKYTEKGDEILIKTEEKDGKLLLSIEDTGIGISDEAIGHVFERFYREDKAHSRETGGSGLGLAIASSIVAEHGGTIQAKHNNPKGTIIEIRIKK